MLTTLRFVSFGEFQVLADTLSM